MFFLLLAAPSAQNRKNLLSSTSCASIKLRSAAFALWPWRLEKSWKPVTQQRSILTSFHEQKSFSHLCESEARKKEKRRGENTFEFAWSRSGNEPCHENSCGNGIKVHSYELFHAYHMCSFSAQPFMYLGTEFRLPILWDSNRDRKKDPRILSIFTFFLPSSSL